MYRINRWFDDKSACVSFFIKKNNFRSQFTCKHAALNLALHVCQNPDELHKRLIELGIELIYSKLIVEAELETIYFSSQKIYFSLTASPLTVAAHRCCEATERSRGVHCTVVEEKKPEQSSEAFCRCEDKSNLILTERADWGHVIRVNQIICWLVWLDHELW